MKLVNVSERLPEREAEYFVIADGIKCVGIFTDGQFWADDKKLNVSKWLDESAESEQLKKLFSCLCGSMDLFIRLNNTQKLTTEGTIIVSQKIEDIKQLLTETDNV